jgi:hypothetical protein
MFSDGAAKPRPWPRWASWPNIFGLESRGLGLGPEDRGLGLEVLALTLRFWRCFGLEFCGSPLQ